MEKLETTILNNLINNELFCRKALPHIKPEYFQGADRVVYELIISFITKYNKLPNSKILDIEYQKSDYSNRSDPTEISDIISSFGIATGEEIDWLINTTEKWCKDRAVHNGVMEAITIIDGKSEKAPGAIPDILSKALSVTFDTAVGHDFIDDAEKRFDFYHLEEVFRL